MNNPKGYSTVVDGLTKHGDLAWNPDEKTWQSLISVGNPVKDYHAICRDMTDCLEIQAMAENYAKNLLQLHDKLRVARHLTNCAACGNLVDKLRKRFVK